eukprot:2180532-Pleurochrysis_carterae.AAC.2
MTRRPNPYVELVSKECFLSISVVLTRQPRQNLEKPVLSRDYMAYLRPVASIIIEEKDDAPEELDRGAG